MDINILTSQGPILTSQGLRHPPGVARPPPEPPPARPLWRRCGPFLDVLRRNCSYKGCLRSLSPYPYNDTQTYYFRVQRCGEGCQR